MLPIYDQQKTHHTTEAYGVYSQIYYNNTRLQCARSACALGTGLTRPFHDDMWRQSVFIYARCYQSIKRDSIFTSFIIRGWSARWARAHDWPK